ncbi:putative cytosolic iron-sulfur protein assembly protein CIAO1, partial [Dictyocoela roeselum]
MGEKILAVAIQNETILFGGTSRSFKQFIFNEKRPVTLAKHAKSIRSITYYKEYYACASYDGTATVFKGDQVVGTIEGPHTEIKCIRINDEYIACSTRGGDIWIYDKNCEIHSIIPDVDDIKGVLWHENLLLSYGYGSAIKIYQCVDDKWILLRELKQETIIWDALIFEDSLVSCDNDGFIWMYVLDGAFSLYRKIKGSMYPIYKMCSGNGCLFYICNRNIIQIVDTSFRRVNTVWVHQELCREPEGYKEDINCIDYSEESKLLVAGGDKLFCIY